MFGSSRTVNTDRATLQSNGTQRSNLEDMQMLSTDQEDLAAATSALGRLQRIQRRIAELYRQPGLASAGARQAATTSATRSSTVIPPRRESLGDPFVALHRAEDAHAGTSLSMTTNTATGDARRALNNMSVLRAPDAAVGGIRGAPRNPFSMDTSSLTGDGYVVRSSATALSNPNGAMPSNTDANGNVNPRTFVTNAATSTNSLDSDGNQQTMSALRRPSRRRDSITLSDRALSATVPRTADVTMSNTVENLVVRILAGGANATGGPWRVVEAIPLPGSVDEPGNGRASPAE